MDRKGKTDLARYPTLDGLHRQPETLSSAKFGEFSVQGLRLSRGLRFRVQGSAARGTSHLEENRYPNCATWYFL